MISIRELPYEISHHLFDVVFVVVGKVPHPLARLVCVHLLRLLLLAAATAAATAPRIGRRGARLPL